MPWKSGALPDGNLDRDDLVREPRLDLLIDAIEVRVLLVHHRDDEQHRIAATHRFAEHALGAHFDAGGRRHDAQGAVSRGESGDRVALKIQIAGRIQQIDLRVLPLGVCATEVDRVAALRLFGGGVGEGGAVFHRSVPLRAS